MQFEKKYIAALTFASIAASPSVHAEYVAAIEPAIRYATVSEHDQAGNRIVHESGWLPGVGAQLAYRSGAWEIFGAAALFQADIDYDGQLQNGRPYRSETGTRMAEAQLGLRYRILDATEFITALGLDSWRRHIDGSSQAIGLQEHTRSSRVLIGVEQAWRLGETGKVLVGASLVHAAPERVRIGFSGLLDDVTIRTRASNGYALTLRFQPEEASKLSFNAHFDLMKVARSAAYPVTRDGRAAGDVTQPEHVRRNLTLSIRYSF